MNLPPPTTPAKTPVLVPKRTAHGVHLTHTVLTFGMWIPVWIIAAILNSGKTTTEWV